MTPIPGPARKNTTPVPRNLNRSTLLFLGIELALLSGIAALSGYRVPEFTDANWDTVLFLAPSGIVMNHLDSGSVIRTFYNDPSPGQTPLAPLTAAGMALLWAGLALNLGVFWRIAVRPSIRPGKETEVRG